MRDFLENKQVDSLAGYKLPSVATLRMLSLPWTECPVSNGLDVQIPWNTQWSRAYWVLIPSLAIPGTQAWNQVNRDD